MTHTENWLEKRFDFDFPASRYVEFVAFLRATPDKVETLVGSLPRAVLVRRDGDSWSLQENAGHFLSTESLFMGRLDDYENGASVLRAARFEENPTDLARYNEKDLGEILATFREQRRRYVARLEALPAEIFARTSLHPRLNQPMRLCDILLFQVEHDRHHLARIDELKVLWKVT